MKLNLKGIYLVADRKLNKTIKTDYVTKHLDDKIQQKMTRILVIPLWRQIAIQLRNETERNLI